MYKQQNAHILSVQIDVFTIVVTMTWICIIMTYAEIQPPWKLTLADFEQFNFPKMVIEKIEMDNVFCVQYT